LNSAEYQNIRPFQYDELAAATNIFAEENKLGRGRFGPVYRGFLRDPSRHVAVKLLSSDFELK
jgi:hypothetical protein